VILRVFQANSGVSNFTLIFGFSDRGTIGSKSNLEAGISLGSNFVVTCLDELSIPPLPGWASKCVDKPRNKPITITLFMNDTNLAY
jgi:hypothetical protein